MVSARWLLTGGATAFTLVLAGLTYRVQRRRQARDSHRERPWRHGRHGSS